MNDNGTNNTARLDELRALHDEIIRNLRSTSKAERETIITATEGDEWVKLYTASRRKMKELFTKQLAAPEHIKILKHDANGVQFEIAACMVKIVLPARRRRLTDEEKAERVARLSRRKGDAA